jgi:GntR family transcriptional regulator
VHPIGSADIRTAGFRELRKLQEPCAPRCIMALTQSARSQLEFPMNSQSKPVYLKLRDLIAAAILDGRYEEGAMLPSVRALAAEQGANPLTVAKAYQQFQADGLVEVQRGVGMYVVDGAAERLRKSERRQFIAEEWPTIRERIDRLGLDVEDLLSPA